MRIKEFLCLFKKYIHSIHSDALLYDDKSICGKKERINLNLKIKNSS